jgi:hypothetical protein
MGGDFMGDVWKSIKLHGLPPRNTNELLTSIALTAQGLDASKPADQRKELALRKLLGAILDCRDAGLLE